MTNNGWISVKKALPPEVSHGFSAHVLVCTGLKRIFVSYYCHSAAYWPHNRNVEIEGKPDKRRFVRYWQPLPSPPD